MINKVNKIYLGKVVSNKDVTHSGRLSAYIEEYSSDIVEVTYTSPFYSKNSGGMIALPEVGTDILVYHLDSNNAFYYISTVVDHNSSSEKDPRSSILKNWKIIADKYVFKDKDIPQVITFTDPFNNGMRISSTFAKKFISSKVELISQAGKKVLISDSPKANFIKIRNEHGDGITITSKENPTLSDRAILMKSNGPQMFTVFESEMDLRVIDGRDINIENLSTGINGLSPGQKSGNVNVRSKHSDITLHSEGSDGRIFIITPKARIQIQADGSVMIEALNVQIKSDTSISMDSPVISMHTQSFNLIADASIAMQGGATVSILSPGVVSIDGTTALQLNSQTSVPPIPTIQLPLDKNDYQE